MGKLLLLVLTVTASVAFASPPVQNEKLLDPVVKAPVVEKEATVELKEAEAGPLVQDGAVAEADPLVQDGAVAEAGPLVQDGAVAEAGPLVQDEAVAEADPLVQDGAVVEADPLVQDEAVAEADPLVQDETVAEADPLVQDEAVAEADPLVQDEAVAEADPLVQDEAVADSSLVEPDSALLDAETTEEQTAPEETQVMLEEPDLEADYLTVETPETELQPELEVTIIETDSSIVPVEEAEAELESETKTEMEDEKEENEVKDEPTLEADYIMAEDPEIQMEPGREPRRTRIGWGICRGVVVDGKCYQFFTRNLNAYQAEFYCQAICRNGHLASVTSSYIRSEIGKLMDRNGGRTRAWLGGRRIFNTRNFRWLDGTPWSYNGWASGEPNNAGGQENCVETWYNLAFNDAPCTIHKPFVCSCPL